MLVLSTLHTLLSQIIAPATGLHTAVLSTPAGHLVCYASDPGRPKDEIRVIVGLSGEVWQETLSIGPDEVKERTGMVSSELGRILVLPVDVDEPVQPQGRLQPQTKLASTTSSSTTITPTGGKAQPADNANQQEYTPLMLLTLNSSEAIDWEELQVKGKALAAHIAKPLSKYREHLAPIATPPAVKTPPIMPSISGTHPLTAK